MQFDFSQLLTAHYFFDRTPGGDFLLGYFLLGFFILLFFARSLVLRFGPQDKYFRKSIRKRFGRFVALGVVGILLVASRFAEIPLFSMRIWLYLILLLSIALGAWTGWSIYQDYQKRLRSVYREKKKHAHSS
ncbi:hypothetical protein K9M59_01925 [Candidatus Gracilibacteria bacterium]|nr:hypothetical protein [Candidatus Gracilibacteria bacterium]MCF7819606.1 hypothetical protein [Candidatus Gracilibacteria bacterium]